jgi:single-strand DNA-binding protein
MIDMLNHTVLVGRLVDQPQKDEKGASITIAVPRSYKNEKGEYETDFIPVRLFNGVAENTCEYCKKGDLIGIKGRLQSNEKLELIAEKVTFLSTNKENGED